MEKPEQQLIKQIPNAITLTNLFVGCMAIVYVYFDHSLKISAYLIMLAAVLDFLDGFIAKRLNAMSEMGKQLDSFADMISFGVAPGLILFQMLAIYYQQQENAFEFTKAHYFPGFIFTLFAAIRLSKFNISENKKHFKGIPTPAAALFVASLPLITFYGDLGLGIYILRSSTLYIITAVISYLMISDMDILSLKFDDFKWQGNEHRIVLCTLAILLGAIFKFESIPMILVLYILISKHYFKNKN